MQFSSAGSADPDGQPITFSWNFGDGGTSAAANPSHTYTSNGNFTAQLTVRDPAGNTGVANVLISVGNTAPTVVLTAPPGGGFFDWGNRVNFSVTVTDPEDGAINCSRVVLQYSIGHDEHAHPIQQYSGCSGVVQTSLSDGHGADSNIFGVLEATYTDNGGLVGRSLVQLQPKRKQAEHFVATGRVPGSTAGGDPGVVRETTGDPQGGLQNIGFIEDGDWWSFSPTNLTGIQQVRLRAASGGTGGRVEIRAGSATGTLLGTAVLPSTGGWQTYTDVTVAVSTNTVTGPLFFVASPPVGTPNGGGLFNVNWIDFVGQGVGLQPAATPLSPNVHLFYYPWYGAVNGTFRHWQQGGHTPPDDVGADLYPTLGAYDSGDFAGPVAQHMAWVRRSGAGVIVYSWWGQGSYEDNLVTGVLNAAQQQGIKVAWHLEPYPGRTAASTVSDINYINSRYGNHPAFYRSAQHANRGAFYVFESLLISDWTVLDQVTGSSIVLAQTTNTSLIAHFSGMYTYDAIAGATAPGWEQAGEYAAANGLVWSPSVGPGYIDDRAVPGNSTPTLARNNGSTYDTEWGNALDPTKGGVLTWVSVTSFNEWHEGSTIEPARSSPPTGFNYQTYSGAYGQTGAAAETAYLDRTAFWVTEFETRRVPGAVNLALNKPATADGQCAPTEGPAKAVNGTVAGGNADKWCSLGTTKFLRIDLGNATLVGRFVLRHAAAGNEPARFNTRDFDIQTSPDGITWTTRVTARTNTADITTHTITPVSARYLRLNVLIPTQDTDTAARIYEFEAYAV